MKSRIFLLKLLLKGTKIDKKMPGLVHKNIIMSVWVSLTRPWVMALTFRVFLFNRNNVGVCIINFLRFFTTSVVANVSLYAEVLDLCWSNRKPLYKSVFVVLGLRPTNEGTWNYISCCGMFLSISL